MGELLRVLFVMDSEDDASMLVDRLQGSGYDPVWKRVDKTSSMSAALDQGSWDIIIADHPMSGFSVPAALALIRQTDLDLPFIIVSSAIGEETAVAAMKAGAHDYIRKDDLARLVPAIERELGDAAARHEHRRVEEALLESLQTSMETVQAIPSGLFIYQTRPPNRLILIFGNPEAERLTGIRIEEWLGKEFDEIWPAAREMGITESFHKVLESGEVFESEELSYRDEKLEGAFRVRAFPMAGGRLGVAFESITERKRAEEALAWESEVNAAMAELSKTLLQRQSIEDVSSVLLEYAKRLTRSEFGYVGYIDPETGYLVSPTLTKDIWETCQVPDKDIVFEKFTGLWGWVLDNRKPLLTNAPNEDPRSSGTPPGHIPIHRFLSVPAVIDNTLVGQVALANSDRNYSERDLVLAERLAALYAIAIRQKHSEDQIQKHACALDERIKELNCLYGISRLVEKPGITLDEILQETVELIPPSWQYPEITCARILLEEREFSSRSCKESLWRQASDIVVHGERVGSIEIFYLERKPDRYEGPFLKEERKLIDAIADHLGRTIQRIQAQDALRKEKEKAQNYLDIAGAILVVVDPDQRVSLINNEGCEILGYEEKEIIGENWFDCFLPEHVRERVRTSFKGILAGNIEMAEHYENPILTKAGKERFVAWHNTVLTDEAGNIIGTLSSGEDITERKRAEDAVQAALEKSRKHAAETSALLISSRAILERQEFEEMEQAIFDSCKTLIGATAGYIALMSEDERNNEVLFLDSGGRSCAVDPDLPMPIRGLRAEAYACGESVYENIFAESEWTDFLPEGHVVMDNVMFAPLKLEGKVVGVMGLANKPGGFTDDDARMAAAFADQAAIALQSSRNLEALRESEASYRKLSESLEESVKEKVAEFRQAESLAAIGRMVSIVAHEVRNPLQNIQMGVDSIRKEIGDDKEKNEILEEIDYGVNLLNGIIAELLYYSRPVALKYSSRSVRELVDQVLKTMARKLDDIGVNLDLEHEDRPVWIDPFRINAVLINLIANAAEAMPAGGQITITSRFAEDNGANLLRLAIEDTGCGIGKEDLKQVHEPFFTTKTRGTGLGLPVCKKIVEAHGGGLSITSKVNEGTTAQIWIPIDAPQKQS